MKPMSFGLIVALLSTAMCMHAQQPPAIKKQPKIFNEHGQQRTDEYFWLSDPSDTNVIHHLHAENAYVEAYMKHTEDLQQKIYDEIVARIPQRDQSLPTKRNGYWYYTRFEEGKQYPYFARKKGTTLAKEELLLDVPALAAPYKVYIVRGTATSANNQLYAYGVDTSGARKSILYIKNLATGKLYPETITNTSGNYVWANDNRTLFYVLYDHTVRAYKVMKHVLGTSTSNDREVYTERDSTYSVYLNKSRNNRFIFINLRSTNTTEVRYLDASKPDAKPVVVQERIPDLEYRVSYHEGEIFHIYTNKDAKNFKFVKAPISKPGVENWTDVIPRNDKAYLENAEVLKNYYVIQTRENGLNRIKIMDRRTNKWINVPFGQEVYVADMYLATDDFASDSIRYYFTSMVTPPSEYLYNIRTGQRKLLKRQEVGGGYNEALYETKRVWSTSRDGVKVPVSLVYRKDQFRRDGTKPLLLYAYGSYGASMDPYFNSTIFSLLDRGVTFAIAHIRGGQEMGREWYEQGRILTKKNTFNDFIDAAEFLVKEKYTSKDRMFANGGSAGGMLMGAVTNMRPDLFKGIIAEVPWMDVITDMFNTDLPLTTLEYKEWGDPNVKEHYDYMLSWSPQDNVRPAKYPAILATGGLHDTQVPYFSPAKWVARVRENNQGTNPVLFKVNMGAGHGGASGRFERHKLTALKMTFLLDQLKWNEKSRTFEGLLKPM
ncbi:MAG TPA: S9 family peptidase [Flavisolibacter sp.]